MTSRHYQSYIGKGGEYCIDGVLFKNASDGTTDAFGIAIIDKKYYYIYYIYQAFSAQQTEDEIFSTNNQTFDCIVECMYSALLEIEELEKTYYD